MKAIVYWTLTRSAYGHTYAAFAVTSEGPRGRINGRFSDGFASHTTQYRCKGRFETEDAAKAKVAEIEAINKRFADIRRPYYAAINAAERDEDAAIAALLNTKPDDRK